MDRNNFCIKSEEEKEKEKCCEIKKSLGKIDHFFRKKFLFK